MNKQQHDQLKTTFLKIDEILKNKDLNLSAKEKAKFEQLKSESVAAMFSSWLPAAPSLKIIMLIIFLIGLYGIIKINLLFALLWLILVFFSPRIIGQVSILLGKISKK